MRARDAGGEFVAVTDMRCDCKEDRQEFGGCPQCAAARVHEPHHWVYGRSRWHCEGYTVEESEHARAEAVAAEYEERGKSPVPPNKRHA